MTIAKYIVMEKESNGVRFFACGIVNEDKTFTGIIHDYVGGGNYQEALVFKDQWIPTAEEWDEQVKIFDSLSPVDLETIEFSYTEDLLFYNTDENVQNYCVFPEALDMFNENGVLIDNMSLVVPYGLGNTTFPDGYEIDEALKYDVVIYETENDFLSENKSSEDLFSSYDDALECAEETAEKNYLVAVQVGGYTLESFKSDSDNKGQIVGLTAFEELLEKADLITIDGSPYLHTWDHEDDYLISTIYEEDGLTYATNIDKLEIFAIYKEGNVYKIVCEDTDYKVTLHTLNYL